MRHKSMLVLIVLVVAVGAMTAHGGTQQKGAVLVSVYSGFPAVTGTEDPFDAWPLLGVKVERVFPNGFSLSGSLEFSRWKDFVGGFYTTLGEFTGAWTFTTWSPVVHLGYHFAPFSKRIDPYLGVAGGIRFARHSNKVTDYSPSWSSSLDSKPFLRGFAGIRVYPFSRNGGSLRNFSLMAQVAAHLGKDFPPFMLMVGASQRF